MALHVSVSRLTLLAALALPACATERLHGPVQDLHTLATPAPPPAVPPAPRPASGRWRAWVPPQTTAAGDITHGHWVELTLAPPRVEVVAPVAPLPRAPKSGVAPKPLGGPPAPPVAGAPVSPAAPTAVPGATPPGATPGATPRTPTLRLPQALRNGMPGVAEETR